MSRSILFSAVALLSALAALPATSATAADLVLDRGDYRARSDHAPRQVERDYDEDNHQGRRRGGDWRGQWGSQHHIRRVEARASYASDYLPGSVKEWRARRSAIEAWSAKVASIYGESFAHWRGASDKQVACDGGAGSVYCIVSARPARGWQNGWSRWGRERHSRND
ncbi:MAG: hypothetical protein ABL907_08665 [Hyphomicrobium sp.]